MKLFMISRLDFHDDRDDHDILHVKTFMTAARREARRTVGVVLGGVYLTALEGRFYEETIQRTVQGGLVSLVCWSH